MLLAGIHAALQTLLEHGQPPLLEATDLRQGEAGVGESAATHATARAPRLAAGSLLGELLEPLEVELARLDPDRNTPVVSSRCGPRRAAS
jgi:hypothetical protein